jgi:hypothetical protein
LPAVSLLKVILPSIAALPVPTNTNRKSVHDAAMDEKVIEDAADASV